MPNTTPNLSLEKPTTNENYDVNVQNNNMDKIDAHAGNNSSHVPYVVATGPANTYAVTLNPVPTAYTDGMALCVKINVASTGASTINVNGLGAKSIRDSLGNAITNGGLKANTPYTLRYENTSGNFIVQGKGGGGDATAGDLLSGKTATVDSGQITGTLTLTGTAVVGDILSGKTAYTTDAKAKITGTMANRGAVTITPSTVNQTILQGYHDGSGIVQGDADLIASNIKSGVNIFGVVGSVIEGKRWATGSTGVITAGSSYTVTGLNFTPRNILMYEVYGTDTTNVTRYATFWSTYTNSQQSFHTRSGDNYAGIVTNIVLGGFTINAGANTTGGIIVREWIAFE